MRSLENVGILLLTILCHCGLSYLIPSDVVIVVLSQDNFQTSQARQLKDDVWNQTSRQKERPPFVHLTSEDFPHPGAWTVLPILRILYDLHGGSSLWVLFCESYTKINVKNLLQYLDMYDPTEEMWIGHAMYDREPTVIHHYAFIESSERPKYPNFASGFVVSNGLLETLVLRLTHEGLTSNDFSIDPSHELALFIKGNGDGPNLTHGDFFCLKPKSICATFPQAVQSCGEPVKATSVYFGVKTCDAFHDDRIPNLLKTWGRYAVHIGLYSNVEDPSIPTIDLGIRNVATGHCLKTLAILKDIMFKSKDTPYIKWVVIADDDTIFSVARLLQFLACFDSSEDIALGERYGYNVYNSELGFNYITGGGGMVFSMTLVSKILQSGQCRCPAINTPDDMFLGRCLAQLGVTLIHSPNFHQARPSDYPPEYMLPQKPVSFHRHRRTDPVIVYKRWFAAADREIETLETRHGYEEL